VDEGNEYLLLMRKRRKKTCLHPKRSKNNTQILPEKNEKLSVKLKEILPLNKTTT